MTIRISLVKAAELSGAQLEAWNRIQRSSTALDSPFFSAEFARVVARFRDDVEVAVLQQADEYVGFFPFQRSGGKWGRPVGWKLNDFQGAILANPCEVDPSDLLRQCGLVTMSFDHLLATQQWCGKAHMIHHVSPYIDVTDGYEAYLAGKVQHGAQRLKTVMRKARKLSRDAGEFRFEFDCKDPSVFRRLLQWKSEQLCAWKVFNIFELPWIPQVLEALRTSRAEMCRGILSAAWAGDELVAAHFGIVNDKVLHWLITAYNDSFQEYSPGSILLINLVEHAAAHGLRRIDLGRGTESYKRSFQTGETALSEGAIALTPWRQAAHRVAYELRQSVRTSWMHPAIQYIKWARSHFTSLGRPRQPPFPIPGTAPDSP